MSFSSLNIFLFSCAMLFSIQAFGQLDRIKTYFKELEESAGENPVTLSFIQEDQQLVDDFSRLSQIILVRHGEPALDKKGGRKRKEAMAFIQAYDTVGVEPLAYLPVEIGQDELKVIYTSSLNRAKSTARLVFNRPDLEKPDSLFREFERKIFSFPNIKLPLNWWLVGSRVFWFMGFNHKGIETFSMAKSRTKLCAGILYRDATSQGKTVLVAHGLLNRYLVKYLKKYRFVEVYDGGKGYLSQRLLVRYEE